MSRRENEPVRGWSWRRFLARLSPLLALAIIVLGTVAYEQAFVEPDNRAFLKPENILNILRQASPVGIIAVGMTFVIIAGGIDLSVGSIVAFVGVFGLLTLNRSVDEGWAGGSSAAAIIAGVAVMVLGGTLLGLLNGLLVSLGRLTPFIATLGTMAIWRSLALALADGGAVNSRASGFGSLGSGGVPMPFLETSRGTPTQLHYPILVFLGVAVTGWILMRFTNLGIYVRAVGDNQVAAAYSAVRVGRVRTLAFTILGLTCGLAAVVMTSRQNSVSSPAAGSYYELDAIAAVVIGGTLMQGGAGSIIGTVIGVLTLSVIGNMLVLVGVGSHYQGLAKGLIIVAAVLVQRAGRRA